VRTLWVLENSLVPLLDARFPVARLAVSVSYRSNNDFLLSYDVSNEIRETGQFTRR
jgi:hypothetical protein